jgi:polyisoprenoid-binding protein YceI
MTTTILTQNRKTLSRISFALLLIALFTLIGCSPPGEEASSSADIAKGTSTALPFSENSTVFEIIPAESQARFLIDEILHGEEKTVIGKTNQVTGQIAFDFSDPSTAAAGPIKISALTLETDSGFRNRAIQNYILLSRIYEYVIFTPTTVNELPQNIVIGEAVEFQIEGDLTITAHTQPLAFTVTAVPFSESRLEGSATATINRSDFDLVVPSATGVAAVGETVILELDFAAAATEEE